MKTMFRITIAAFLVFISTGIKAQTLEESLNETTSRFDTSKTLKSMMETSSAFDMITNKWPDELMSNYYSAWSKGLLSYAEPDVKRKDLILDQGDKYFAKVKQIQPESDETYVLAAMLTNARLAVDGQNRWKQYGELFNQQLEKAKSINADNPRIYYLKGASVFYTPKMFGGGKKKAQIFFEKAKTLFEKQDKTTVLKPRWGEKMNEDYLRQCNEK